MSGITWKKAGQEERLKELWKEARKQYPTLQAASEALAEHFTDPDRSHHAVRSKLKYWIKEGEVEDLVTASAEVELEDARDAVSREREIERYKSERDQYKDKYREVLEHLAFQDEMVSLAREIIEPLPPVSPPPPPDLAGGDEDPQSDILDVSDFHFGETVSGEQMRGINEYDFQIGKKRWQYLVEKVIDLRTNHHGVVPVKELNLNFLGDMVGGVLHDKEEYAQGSIVERVFIGASVLAQGVYDLLGTYPLIKIRGVVGNESRMAVRKKYRGRYVNWDFILYHMMRQYLRDQDRIEWEIPQSFFTVATIEGKEHLILHGDDIRAWNGIPFYGIRRAVAQFTQLQNMQDTRLDYIHLGHFHQGTSLPAYRGEVLVNGAGMGTDEYAFVALRGGGPPTQWFVGAHEKYGITWRYRIDLSFADEEIDEPRYTGELFHNVQDQLEDMGL